MIYPALDNNVFSEGLVLNNGRVSQFIRHQTLPLIKAPPLVQRTADILKNALAKGVLWLRRNARLNVFYVTYVNIFDREDN